MLDVLRYGAGRHGHAVLLANHPADPPSRATRQGLTHSETNKLVVGPRVSERVSCARRLLWRQHWCPACPVQTAPPRYKRSKTRPSPRLPRKRYVPWLVDTQHADTSACELKWVAMYRSQSGRRRRIVCATDDCASQSRELKRKPQPKERGCEVKWCCGPAYRCTCVSHRRSTCHDACGPPSDARSLKNLRWSQVLSPPASSRYPTRAPTGCWCGTASTASWG